MTTKPQRVIKQHVRGSLNVNILIHRIQFESGFRKINQKETKHEETAERMITQTGKTGKARVRRTEWWPMREEKCMMDNVY